MTKDSKLEASLLLMRLAIAAFLLVWAMDKVIAPEHAQAVFSHFYFSELSQPALKAIGIVQMVVIAAFVVGFARFWTYGEHFTTALRHTCAALIGLGLLALLPVASALIPLL